MAVFEQMRHRMINDDTTWFFIGNHSSKSSNLIDSMQATIPIEMWKSHRLIDKPWQTICQFNFNLLINAITPFGMAGVTSRPNDIQYIRLSKGMAASSRKQTIKYLNIAAVVSSVSSIVSWLPRLEKRLFTVWLALLRCRWMPLAATHEALRQRKILFIAK